MKEKFLTVWRSCLLFSLVLNAVFLAACVIFASFRYTEIADYTNSVLICRQHTYANATINYLLASLIGTTQYGLTFSGRPSTSRAGFIRSSYG